MALAISGRQRNRRGMNTFRRIGDDLRRPVGIPFGIHGPADPAEARDGPPSAVGIGGGTRPDRIGPGRRTEPPPTAHRGGFSVAGSSVPRPVRLVLRPVEARPSRIVISQPVPPRSAFCASKMTRFSPNTLLPCALQSLRTSTAPPKKAKRIALVSRCCCKRRTRSQDARRESSPLMILQGRGRRTTSQA